MKQDKAWDKEYKKPVLVTKYDQPQKDTLKFIKFAKKEGVTLNNASVLDLGSGTGRNANYLAKEGAQVTGLETSAEAIKIARERAAKLEINVKYFKGSIGKTYPLDNDSVDLTIDVFTSHLLTEEEREIYLNEVARVLKPGGLFFVKTMAKEGDANAQSLLRSSPGKEKDTYILPELNIQERVFSEADFRDLYSKDFQIIKIEKKTALIPFKNQSYKRRFLVAYLKKI